MSTKTHIDYTSENSICILENFPCGSPNVCVSLSTFFSKCTESYSCWKTFTKGLETVTKRSSSLARSSRSANAVTPKKGLPMASHSIECEFHAKKLREMQTFDETFFAAFIYKIQAIWVPVTPKKGAVGWKKGVWKSVECDIKDCRQSGRVNQLAADKIVTMAKGYITQFIFSTRENQIEFYGRNNRQQQWI